MEPAILPTKASLTAFNLRQLKVEVYASAAKAHLVSLIAMTLTSDL